MKKIFLILAFITATMTFFACEPENVDPVSSDRVDNPDVKPIDEHNFIESVIIPDTLYGGGKIIVLLNEKTKGISDYYYLIEIYEDGGEQYPWTIKQENIKYNSDSLIFKIPEDFKEKKINVLIKLVIDFKETNTYSVDENIIKDVQVTDRKVYLMPYQELLTSPDGKVKKWHYKYKINADGTETPLNNNHYIGFGGGDNGTIGGGAVVSHGTKSNPDEIYPIQGFFELIYIYERYYYDLGTKVHVIDPKDEGVFIYLADLYVRELTPRGFHRIEELTETRMVLTIFNEKIVFETR